MQLLLIDGFSLFGVQIKFYGVLMAVAFIIGLILASKFAKYKGYDSNLPYDLLMIVFPSAIIGARLNYVLFTLDNGWTFVEILQIWNGGLMIYGGIIFAVIAIAIYCLVKKINIISVLDMLAPCLILGQAIGRWGNFFNQEAYGSLITNEKLQWFPFGVYIDNSHFTNEAKQQLLQFFGNTDMAGAWFNATFFYESIWCLAGFFLLYFLFKKTNKIGLTTATYFVFYGIERFFVEMLRTDSLYLGSIKISVLISLCLVIAGTIWLTVLLVKSHKEKKAKMSVELDIKSNSENNCVSDEKFVDCNIESRDETSSNDAGDV